MIESGQLSTDRIADPFILSKLLTHQLWTHLSSDCQCSSLNAQTTVDDADLRNGLVPVPFDSPTRA